MKELTPAALFVEILLALEPDEWDNHRKTLFCKMTYESMKIVERYKYKNLVSAFINILSGDIWFKIPFGFPDPITK